MPTKMDKKIQNTLDKKANAPKDNSLRSYVNRMVPAFARALPDPEQSDRFARAVLTALSTTPKLNECTPESFCGAMMMSAQLGLIPNTPEGLAYLIPYGRECQFQLGYRGMIQLAWRSGQIKSIEARIVYEGDEFEYSFGLNPTLNLVPAPFEERGEPIKCYAKFETISGGFGFEVMSIEEIKAHAQKYSKNYNSKYSPWKTDFNSMAKKTVLKQALKYAPLSTEFNRQLNADETIKHTQTSASLVEDVDVLDLPNDFTYEIEEENGGSSKEETKQETFK